MLFPRDNELPRFDIIHQARIRVDPLDLPFVSTNVFHDAYALKGSTRRTLFSQPVFDSGFDSRFQHPSSLRNWWESSLSQLIMPPRGVVMRPKCVNGSQALNSDLT